MTKKYKINLNKKRIFTKDNIGRKNYAKI